MLHTMDPFLLQISGNFGIRWYGLSYLAGFVCAYYLFSWISRRQHQGLNSGTMISDFVTYGAIGALVGGRLGYCLFYSPELFLQFRPGFPFWGVLAVNEGGMASHGGMLGLVAACWIFANKHHLKVYHLLDLVCLAGPIGIFFGRLANYINGELVGRIAPPDYPLAVKFPQDIMLWPQVEPSRVQSLTESVKALGIPDSEWSSVVTQFQSSGGARDQLNSILSQIIDAVQNGNAQVSAALTQVLDPRYPSQLFAAVGEGLLVFIGLLIIWRKPQKPGIIGCWFLILYGIARITGEQFRLPDLQIGFQLFGLTRGQWLSIGMLVIAAILMFILTKRESMKINGWKVEPGVKYRGR